MPGRFFRSLILLGLLCFTLPSSAIFPVYAQAVAATVTVGASPQGVAVNPVTNRIYVANQGDDSVSVIDGINNAVVSTVGVGSRPEGVAVNPTSNRIYVTNTEAGSVSVLDGATNAVVATVQVGARPIHLAANSANNRVYVANAAGNSVSVIDGNSNSVEATIDFASGPTGIALNMLTNQLYVITTGSQGVLSVIDTGSNSLITTIPSGSNSADVTVDPSTNRVYMTNTMIGNISVINGANNSVETTVRVAENQPVGTFAVAANPVRNRVYVASFSRGVDSLSVFDGGSNTFLETAPVSGGLGGIAVNPSTGRIYAANPTANTVSVIEDTAPPQQLPKTGDSAPLLLIIGGLGMLILAMGMAARLAYNAARSTPVD